MVDRQKPISKCAAAFPEKIRQVSDAYKCPGTMNLLTGKMVPCSDAPTLREIALGRRMTANLIDAPECLPSSGLIRAPKHSSQQQQRHNHYENEENCSCKINGRKNNSSKDSGVLTKNNRMTTESYCRTKNNKSLRDSRCVTFDT